MEPPQISIKKGSGEHWVPFDSSSHVNAEEHPILTQKKTTINVSIEELDRYKDINNIEIRIDGNRRIIDIPTVSLFVAGDSSNVFKYASKPWRQHFTHIWFKNIHTDDTEVLLGISEGKDTYDAIQSLLINLLQEMESHESGFIVDNDMFLIQYHWGGDLIFLMSLLGMKSASSKWWCLHCLQEHVNGEWWKCGPPRDVDAEVNMIESGQETYGRTCRPIIEYWYKMGGRIHYCGLHVNISFARGLVKLLTKRCFEQQEAIDAHREKNMLLTECSYGGRF